MAGGLACDVFGTVAPAAPVAPVGVVIGGLACDIFGTVALTVAEKTKTFAQLISYKGDLHFLIDSSESRLLRPAGCAFNVQENSLYVADLGNNCIKKFRYK